VARRQQGSATVGQASVASNRNAKGKPSARAGLKACEVGPSDEPRPSRKLVAGLCVALVLATIAVYAQVGHYGFVPYDDDQYVMNNDRVKEGLTTGSVNWAFTAFYAANWHPLTWLSHMADWQVFGDRPGAHHLVNVGFHAANVVLLFIAFVWMTRRPWRSAVVAAVFAIHPLHVESVAWVAERKDVLSTFFGLITLLFYIRYARRRSVTRYALMALFFGLSLLAKPMLVTLPLVFLLLDLWPLRRIQWPPDAARLKALTLEKIPLLAMVAGASILTFMAQHSAGAVDTLKGLSMSARLANAAISYVLYIVMAFRPANLAVLYPYGNPMTAAAIGAAGLLIVVTAAALFAAKKRPYALVGWLWYLGMLVPVIGIVQVGEQAMADRYTYLPLVGFSFAFVWLVADLVESRRALRGVTAGVACAALILLAAQAYRQTAYWKSGRTLFEHAIAVTDRNFIMIGNLGVVLDEEGKSEEAMKCYKKAFEIEPEYDGAYMNAGLMLSKQGKREEAMALYERVLSFKPKCAEAHNNLGVILSGMGRIEEAIAHYREALAIKPDYGEARANLGHELLRVGKIDEAYDSLAKAVQELPGKPEAQADLGLALAARGKFEESKGHFEEAIRIAPNEVNNHSNLAYVLTQLGRFDEAIAQCKEAVRLDPNSIDGHYNMGMALAQKGQRAEAAAEMSKVLAINPNHASARAALEKLK